MERQTARIDDYETRRKHLEKMSDAELKDYFWKLTEQAVTPLIELARTHTTPSIERSVLLRMGFSDAEAKAIVDKAIDRRLVGKGVGHVVYRLAGLEGTDVRTAGLRLLRDEGWDRVAAAFGVKS